MCPSNLLEHLEAPRFIKKMTMHSKKINKIYMHARYSDIDLIFRSNLLEMKEKDPVMISNTLSP